jgi:hypothetical protein
MNFGFTIVESSLNRAESRWKWLRFWQRTFALATILCLALVLLSSAILLGWLTSKVAALSLLIAICILGGITWLVLAIVVAASSADRNWLAAALERVDNRLLDRLNTLLFLERHRSDASAESFAMRIAKQTQTVLAGNPSPPAFPATSPLNWLLAFLVVLIGTVLLFELGSPWQRLLAAQKRNPLSPVEVDKNLELAMPPTNNVEQNLAWGEVRITDPGSDLKVTKVDVVPLQIEAAANQALKKVDWYSTINGASETSHDLAPPSEPRYAVYQPSLYLDELHLSDWDVMTYYAKANTEKENTYASDVYFLEVRPFREDILKMPGGEGGSAYQALNEMSQLISKQQHVIRQTHQHLQKPQEQENLQTQDRKKLSEAESDLSESTQHLYAKMAATMENKPIGEALDNLAKAEKSLANASKLLQDNSTTEAQNRERSAMSELVAARKMFQKAVSDNPDAFKDNEGDSPEDEPTPVADAKKKLSEMAEFRNESKAAQDFVRKSLEQQKNLARQAKTASSANFQRLASQERDLQKSLEDFQQLHPQAFKGAQEQSKDAQEAMANAADLLQKKNSGARQAAEDASQGLEKLSQAMQGQNAGQQLANAYKLKQMLDQQIQTFDRRAQGDGKISDADMEKTAGNARDTINQLKKVAEEEPTRDDFAPPLRDSLSGQNKVELDAQLAQLEQAARQGQQNSGTNSNGQTNNPADSQQNKNLQGQAGQAKAALSKVSKAFEASQPQAMQMAQQNDALKPDGQESLAQGMAQLQSLIKQLESQRQLSQQDQSKQGREALFNLQTGMRSQYGNNERATQLLLSVEKALKDQNPVDIGDLKKLMDELQHFSVETADKLAKKEDKPEVTNIDPTRLPPAYRGRIQKYFQKLSEK